MKEAIARLEGHSSNLLTFYLGTLRKYSLLDPMIFNKEIGKNRGNSQARPGFLILRETIFYGLIQDIANIFFDKGKTNPSIVNIMDKLNNNSIVDALRDKYVVEFCANPELSKVYKQRESFNKETFNKELEELFKLTSEILVAKEFKAAKSIRDEFTAHLDLQYQDGNYKYPDITKYGLKWNSPRNMLTQLKPVVVIIGNIVRNADFAWEHFEAQNQELASGFWNP